MFWVKFCIKKDLRLFPYILNMFLILFLTKYFIEMSWEKFNMHYL